MADKQKPSETGEMQRGQTEPSSLAMFSGSRGITSPFSFMRRMMEDLDQLFEDFRLGGERQDMLPHPYVPEIEVQERDGKLVVRADLPGIEKEDVKLSIDSDSLLIEGERKSEAEESREGYYHSERSYGSFSRRVPLPRGVDASTCDASFRNGVLRVELALPTKEANKKPIDIH